MAKRQTYATMGFVSTNLAHMNASVVQDLVVYVVTPTLMNVCQILVNMAQPAKIKSMLLNVYVLQDMTVQSETKAIG